LEFHAVALLIVTEFGYYSDGRNYYLERKIFSMFNAKLLHQHLYRLSSNALGISFKKHLF